MVTAPKDHDDEDAIDAIYESTDDALCEGRFADADAALVALDVETVPIVLLLSWLSITLAAAELLPSRAAFAAKVRARVERDDPEHASELLRGLKAGALTRRVFFLPEPWDSRRRVPVAVLEKVNGTTSVRRLPIPEGLGPREHAAIRTIQGDVEDAPSFEAIPMSCGPQALLEGSQQDRLGAW